MDGIRELQSILFATAAGQYGCRLGSQLYELSCKSITDFLANLSEKSN